ncbi:hypothetical protein CNY89_14395, partial [Amaricoccus sp. HAR-UPW-R2A-40]
RVKNEVYSILAAHLVPKCPHADLFNQRGRAWLRRREVVAWAPCLTKWVRAEVYRRTAKRVVRRPLLPGYVFVKLAEASAWQVIRGVSGVLGLVCLCGRPWPLRPADISRVRHASSRMRAREQDRAMPTNRAFEVGDMVEVLTGPFEAMSLRVYEITKGEARGLVSIFGRETEVQISVANLGAVA